MIATIEHGLLERCAQDSVGIFRILWVGRFIFSKRLDIALDVMSRLGDLNVCMDVYGGGSDSENARYRQLAIDLGVDCMVRWMGMASNDAVLKAMREADLMLFTSVYEATSTVVLEAMQSGLPVVCFDTCGMSYVVDSSIGVKIPLTSPEQSARDFAAAIRRLYGDRAELQRMSANCPSRAEELSWDRKIEQVVGLYERIVENKPIQCT